MTRTALIAALVLSVVALLPTAEAAPTPASSATVLVKDNLFEASAVRLVLGPDGTRASTPNRAAPPLSPGPRWLRQRPLHPCYFRRPPHRQPVTVCDDLCSHCVVS